MEQQHPIAEWLLKAGETRASFARRTEVSEAHLSLILSWKRGLSLDMASKFEDATGGDVKAADMRRREAA